VRFFKARDRPQESALARPGTAEYDNGLTVLDIEIETVQNLAIAIADAQLARGDDRRSRHIR
jgi:hypothetical protein